MGCSGRDEIPSHHSRHVFVYICTLCMGKLPSHPLMVEFITQGSHVRMYTCVLCVWGGVVTSTHGGISAVRVHMYVCKQGKCMYACRGGSRSHPLSVEFHSCAYVHLCTACMGTICMLYSRPPVMESPL